MSEYGEGRRYSLSALLAIAVLLLTGCAGPAVTPEPVVEQPTVEAPTAAPEPVVEQPTVEAPTAVPEPALNVALVLPGSINDLGWNQSGYESLMEAKDSLGLEVSFQESVSAGEVKDVLRNYAADGYDLVIAHDVYFTDAVLEIAPEFPDVMFGVSGGWQGGDNVAAFSTTNWEATYLAGALAGLVTESNRVGVLTATDSPIAQSLVAGFRGGAEATNPGVEVIHAFVGSWDDIAKGKELVASMASQDVDIVYTQSGQVNVGAVEAAQEHGMLAIGAIIDMYAVAPDTVVSSAIMPPGALVLKMIQLELAGDLVGGTYRLGIKDGAEDLAPYHDFESILPQDVKDTIQRIRQDLIDGKVTQPGTP